MYLYLITAMRLFFSSLISDSLYSTGNISLKGREKLFSTSSPSPFQCCPTATSCAGNDGTGALSSIERIALGYQFKKVYDPVIAKGTQGGVTDEILERCRELGQTIAGGIEAGIY